MMSMNHQGFLAVEISMNSRERLKMRVLPMSNCVGKTWCSWLMTIFQMKSVLLRGET
jgi:hypothetical protein